MKKSISVLLFIFAIQIIITSCNIFCSCGCGKSGPIQKITIVSWRAATVAQPFTEVDPNAVLPHDQVYKLITIGDRTISNVFSDESGSFLAAAYACSPAPLEASQTITSIRVTSQVEIAYKNATDIIEVGEDISDRFVMARPYETTLRSIDDFIDQLVIFDNDSYLLRLKEKPAQATILDFGINITLSDGSSFQLEDERLRVN